MRSSGDRSREAVEIAYRMEIIAAIRAQYPRCLSDESRQIAEWTCRKYSGRVGRSAAAKRLDLQALRLAVIAHIRHVHTSYDSLLMRRGDRELARQDVRSDINCILRSWGSEVGSDAASRP